MTKRVFSSSYKVKRPKGDVIMKKLFVLFIAFLVSALSACNGEVISQNSNPEKSTAEGISIEESSDFSDSEEISYEISVDENFPETVTVCDGLTVVKAYGKNFWLFGVMKDGEYIIKPRFDEEPIIKNGKIIFNKNKQNELGSEGYIYDYSGKLIKKVNGNFTAHKDFDYIIEYERYDHDPKTGLHMILDYSLEKLCTAPMGVCIGLAYHSMWSPEIMPYHVEVNGVTVHLKNLIDGIEYPKVEVPDYKNAVGLNPESATVIQTPYVFGNMGRHYDFTDELKSYLKSKLINYLTVADVPFDESKIIFEEDEQDCYASYKLDGNSRVTACCDYILLKTDTEDISREPMTDPFSDPAVLDFCEMTFKTTEGLKVERTSDAYIIYNGSDSVDRGILSLTQKYVRVTVDYEYGFFNYVCAIDLSDENIFPTHTLDALSYAEAEQRFRNGKFVQMTYDLTEIDHENCNIEGVEFVYELITDCCCEECFDIGYYIPCYNFIIRDKDSPEYVGDFLVPAIDLNELNDYLASKSLPRVNHYWTKN